MVVLKGARPVYLRKEHNIRCTISAAKVRPYRLARHIGNPSRNSRFFERVSPMSALPSQIKQKKIDVYVFDEPIYQVFQPSDNVQRGKARKSFRNALITAAAKSAAEIAVIKFLLCSVVPNKPSDAVVSSIQTSIIRATTKVLMDSFPPEYAWTSDQVDLPEGQAQAGQAQAGQAQAGQAQAGQAQAGQAQAGQAQAGQAQAGQA